MSDATTTAVFSTLAEAGNAIHSLEARGFTEAQISILMSEKFGEDFRLSGSAESNGTGADGRVGWKVAGALATRMVRVGPASPGGSAVLVGGPVADELPGPEGVTADRVVEALIGFGASERQAQLFAVTYEDGRVLLVVQCDDGEWQSGADDILRDAGGVQVAHTRTTEA